MLLKKGKKKVKKTTLKRKADVLFSQYIRRHGVCQLKGLDNIHCSGDLQCAHIITRGHLSLRYDPNNALCLCSGHHRYYTTRAELWYWQIIPKHFPENYGYLHDKKNILAHNFDYEEEIKHLESLLQKQN